MKRRIESLVAMGLGIALLLNITAVKRGEAAMLAAATGFGIAGKYYGYEGPSSLGMAGKITTAVLLGTCFGGALFFGPIAWTCLLGEESDGELKLTSEYFADNGYSAQEEAQIRQEHLRFKTAARERNVVLVVQPQDDRAALAQDIRNILPDSSNLYSEFIADSIGLK